MLRYVTACQHGTWHLMIGPPDGSAEYRQVPYRCRSWRHSGECCRWKGAQDFARVAGAIKTRNDWTYIVLTFAQATWPKWQDQYSHSCRIWSKLRHRLTERYGKLAYVQTWERHRKQGIHVNLLLGNELIADEVEEDWRRWKRQVLEVHATAVGFGRVCYVEPMRPGTEASMAGYLTKLARELVGADYKQQIPFDAPPHFRRLRASRGLLPPAFKSGMTGYLVFHPIGKNLRVNDEEA